MIRREALEQVGLLDERFFIYGEDLDLCHRFRSAGWRLVFSPEATAIHYGGASSSAAPVRFYLEMQRANLQYWRKHHGIVASAANYVLLCVHHVFRLLGYSIIFLLPLSNCAEIKHKMRRSWSFLARLMNADVEGSSL
jgi:GT2 family glycosyltransferase